MCVHVLNAQPQMDSGPSDICCTTGQKPQQTPFCPSVPCQTAEATPAAAATARAPSINAGFSELGFLCQSQAPHSILHTIQHQ